MSVTSGPRPESTLDALVDYGGEQAQKRMVQQAGGGMVLGERKGRAGKRAQSGVFAKVRQFAHVKGQSFQVEEAQQPRFHRAGKRA